MMPQQPTAALYIYTLLIVALLTAVSTAQRCLTCATPTGPSAVRDVWTSVVEDKNVVNDRCRMATSGDDSWNVFCQDACIKIVNETSKEGGSVIRGCVSDLMDIPEVKVIIDKMNEVKPGFVGCYERNYTTSSDEYYGRIETCLCVGHSCNGGHKARVSFAHLIMATVGAVCLFARA